jgi:hypothetical protein
MRIVTHFANHAAVIFRAHKPIQRTESSGREQFEVANRAI